METNTNDPCSGNGPHVGCNGRVTLSEVQKAEVVIQSSRLTSTMIYLFYVCAE